MSEDKQRKLAPGKAKDKAEAAQDRERLGREPMVKVFKADGVTYVHGEIDLERLAQDADNSLAEGFEQLRDFAEYDAQGALLDFIETCLGQMRQMGVSEAELAKRMEVSRSYVSRLVNATPNLTVVSLSKLARALGGKIKIELVISKPKPK